MNDTFSVEFATIPTIANGGDYSNSMERFLRDIKSSGKMPL